MTSHLAVFDLDETLVEGDSMSRWHEFLIAQGLVEDRQFLEKDAAFMAKYTAGSLMLDDYLAFSLSPLAGFSAKEVDALATRFVEEKMLSQVYPAAKDQLTKLRGQGASIAIVSASLAFLVHPVANALGADVSMGIDLETENGRYLPTPKGIPSFREGKVHRITQWISAQPHDFEHLSFYTDSINDLPMCLFADEVFVVNPCSQLFKKAGEHNWPVLKWQLKA